MATWFSPITVKVNGSSFTITETNMGCGNAQCVGLSHCFNYLKDVTVVKEAFEEVLPQLKSAGVGGIYFVLGDLHACHEKFILEMGFTKVDQYINHRHSSSYIQRLYTYHIK